MNRHLLITSTALITCIAGQFMFTQDAEACKCKQPPRGLKGVYPSKGTLPANAKGITVVATHWPRNSRIVPKSAAKISLRIKEGDKITPVDVEVHYLGPLANDPNNPPTSQPAKKSKFSAKQHRYMEQMQRNMYLVVPKGGLKSGATYKLNILGGQLYRRQQGPFKKPRGTNDMFNTNESIAHGQPMKKNGGATKPGIDRRFRRPGRRTFSATVTVSKKKIKAPKRAVKAKVKFLKTGVRVPGGARCSMKRRVEAASIKMTVPSTYKNAFIYATFVNGKLWQPRTSLCSETKYGRSAIAPLGEEIVYQLNPRNCGSKLKIESVAMLPGTDKVWWFKPAKLSTTCSKLKRK